MSSIINLAQVKALEVSKIEKKPVVATICNEYGEENQVVGLISDKIHQRTIDNFCLELSGVKNKLIKLEMSIKKDLPANAFYVLNVRDYKTGELIFDSGISVFGSISNSSILTDNMNENKKIARAEIPSVLLKNIGKFIKINNNNEVKSGILKSLHYISPNCIMVQLVLAKNKVYQFNMPKSAMVTTYSNSGKSNMYFYDKANKVCKKITNSVSAETLEEEQTL